MMFPGIHVNRIGEWTGRPLHHRSIKTSMVTPEQNTHFIIIINKLHLHKVHFRPQIAGASRAGGYNRKSSQ